MHLAYKRSYWHPWFPSTITGFIKSTAFVYLLLSNQYVSNQYILDRNPRLSSYTIGVTYSDYISFLLVCGEFPLTLKLGGCWNMLEPTPLRIHLIKSSHKWTQIIFIISNSKLGIWLCSQIRIDLNSKSNFYDVINRPYKYFSNTLYKTTCTKYIYIFSFTSLHMWPGSWQGYAVFRCDL